MSASVTAHVTRPAPTVTLVEPTSSHVGRRWAAAGVVLAALVVVAAWVPFLDRPLATDESGFLLVARQWHHGSSLYGSYWVDRPPLLLWLFSLAGHLGTIRTTALGVIAPGVRFMGAAASGAAVLLTGVLAGLVSPHARWPRRSAVVLAAALLSSPLLGMPETDGEVLAVPFVLLGIVGVVAALRRPHGRQAVVLAAGAGASAVAAALVKQNVVDVFVFAAAGAVASWHRLDRPGPRVAGFAAGATTVLAAAIAGSWMRGTSVAALWDAIVVFRVQASGVIGSSASVATTERLARLLTASVASGAALVLVVVAASALARVVRSRRGDLVPATRTSAPATAWALPVAAVIAWELCGVALGGSYWIHYLTGVVPGLVAAVALTTGATGRAARWARRALVLTVTYTVTASAAVWTHQVTAPPSVSSDAQVMTYLREHARSTDGVVVGFGHPDIVAGSGLTSPYEHLWSLPVRVRDPRLVELRQVMAGPSAPRWVVVAGDTLDTWGLDPADAAEAQLDLQRHWVERATFGSWHVWQHQGRESRTPPPARTSRTA
jgi:hypothetical protein